ncbi:MAG: hypothetical protein MI974_13390 [Chitinophagales bacterium]|nr:hypothetical protein [Chitinophagales bacterium]
MKYLYYSLYQFYTKIIKVQRDFPPVINIAGVLALLQMALLFAAINTILYLWNGKEIVPPYSGLIPGLIGLCFYFFNERYYKSYEQEVIAEIGSKTKVVRMLIIIGSAFIIPLILWLWMGDGLYRIICFFLGREPNLFN